MKRTTINPDKPADATLPATPLTPQSDTGVERQARTVTLRIGDRRYEMTWYSEVREISNDPAKIIEMPRRSASNAKRSY